MSLGQWFSKGDGVMRAVAVLRLHASFADLAVGHARPSTSFMSYRPVARPARKRAARRLPWA